MPEPDLIPIELFFQKSDLVVTFLLVLLGIALVQGMHLVLMSLGATG